MLTRAKSQPEPNALGLLSLTDAATLVGMSASTFYRWRLRNRIPQVCGKNVHIDDIRAAIAKERGLPTSTRNSTQS